MEPFVHAVETSDSDPCLDAGLRTNTVTNTRSVSVNIRVRDLSVVYPEGRSPCPPSAQCGFDVGAFKAASPQLTREGLFSVPPPATCDFEC